MSVATRTLVADSLTPVAAYAALRAADPDRASFLFESVVAGDRWGRFSILGYRPRYEAILDARGAWSVTGDARVDLPGSRDPLEAAEPIFRATDARSAVANPAAKLARAHFGFLAWDLVHAIEKVPGWERTAGTSSPRGPHQTPLARFLGGATIVVFDALAQTVTIAAEREEDVDRAHADLANPAPLRRIALPDRTRIPARVDVSMDDATYEKQVRRAQEYIAAGDAFQIVLARKFRVAREGRDALDVYRAMRVINPSPYMYLLDFPPAPGESQRTQIAGASPETMVRLEDGVMTVRPLAGTRPRGKTLDEDASLEAELLADPKERAEHVMLIDLGRNDVGRVASVGSVKLARAMEIERYSHVMHIVSEVQGRVAPSTPPLEVLRASFPAGTLSGAPKIRAMQIIRGACRTHARAACTSSRGD